MPDLLASRRGRLGAFMLLYVCEGLPFGFASTAIATQMRRQGLGVAEVAAFIGALYAPWALKWAIGPFVDVFSSERLGRRRMWIVLSQILMAGCLAAALPVDPTRHASLFMWIIILHNVFAATQDVAIDALATGVLKEDERGLANGMMFAGFYLGQLVGGPGTLYLTAFVPFRATFLLVGACVLAVTLLVALPLREPRTGRPPLEGPPLAAAGREIRRFVTDAFRAFTGTRAASVGVVFALLPAGAYALGLSLNASLAVELGMSDRSIATLGTISGLTSAAFCMLGGWISDRLGRRRMLALFLAGTTIPAFFMASQMWRFGWLMPVSTTAPGRPGAPHELMTFFCAAAIAHAVFQGLMYGTRTALFMDVTTPAVAATQFTAYMALLNVVLTYTARWQGAAAESWGYPMTLLLDGLLGLICIMLLPLMKPTSRPR